MNSIQRGAIPASIKLLRQALANGQAVRVKVISDSMEPLLQAGDTLVLSRFPIEYVADIEEFIGEMVTVVVGNTLITHRLIGYDKGSVQTAADRSGAIDPLVPIDALLGRVIARERLDSTLPFTSGHGQRVSQKRYRALRRLIAMHRRLPGWLHGPATVIHRWGSNFSAFFY